MRRMSFVAFVVATAAAVVAQSVAHLAVTLRADHIDTFVDLDRSNGMPDLVSTFALGMAAGGAAMLARQTDHARRLPVLLTASLLTALTLADLLHDGAHPFRRGGPLVIATIVLTLGLLAIVTIRTSIRFAVTVASSIVVLAGSFLVGGLEHFDPGRFQRERGDPIAEYQIVAKEGLELLGWSLVALALWDEALRRRRALTATTARASRARAPSRRHAA